MATTQARNFLEKELFIRRSIVTFRSLSRELGIHVNDAKNQLKTFYDATRDTDTPAIPTYLVTGEAPALTFRTTSDTQETGTQQSENAMDVEFEEDREPPEVVYHSKVILVDARELEEVMSEFSRIHSVHIYSLSPSRLGDAGLVCTPSAKVRNADIKGGLESFPIVGKISGAHVKLRPGATLQGAASSSRMTLDTPAKTAPKTSASTKPEQSSKSKSSETKEQISVKMETKDKPKASGKLDWSKAKTKETAKEEIIPKTEPKSAPAVKTSTTIKQSISEAKVQTVSKSKSSASMDVDSQTRGTKRKPAGDSQSESESELLPTKSKPAIVGTSSTVQEPVLAAREEEKESDDDDEPQIRMPGRRRLKAKDNVMSDSEKSLRAMMDIDDDDIDRVSKVRRDLPTREEEEESEQEEDVTISEKETVEPSEDSDDEPIVPKKHRKPRKVVPVGRNGLKKRRVVKSRTTTDAKGYMQTEDYSSYESVEEEDEVVESKSKVKPKQKETKKAPEPKVEDTKPRLVTREDSLAKAKTKAAPKARGGAPKRGGLLNFFGPERGKK